MLNRHAFFILLFLQTGVLFSQKKSISSEQYFPPTDSSTRAILHIIKITDLDTSYTIYNYYQYTEEKGNRYLISITLDEDSLITSFLKEKITPRGLRFNEAKVFLYDKKGKCVSFEVNGNKRLLFPFKNVKKMRGKKYKWRNSYANKVIVKSSMECKGRDSVWINGSKRDALIFGRKVTKKYKGEWEKRKICYSYTWYYVREEGLIWFIRNEDGFLEEGMVVDIKSFK